MQSCPHKQMHECSRYLASHNPGSPWACFLGEDLDQPCAVRRGHLGFEDEQKKDGQ